MADTRPRRNLDPGSEPWGRSVDTLLDQLVSQNARQAESTSIAFKSLNGTLGALSRQVSSLASLTAAIQTQQTTLAATQATLSAQQTSLNNAFNEIAAVSANQVTGASGSNTTPQGVSIVSGGNYAPVTVSVPSGYTRAVVTAVCSIRVVGSNMSLFMTVNIQGNISTPFPVFAETAGAATIATTAGHSAIIGGLSGGQTVTVWGRPTSVSGVTSAYFSNTASFIFLK